MHDRCSVVRYAGGGPVSLGDLWRTCSMPSRDVGSAKYLDEMSDDEWWTYCVPGIELGVHAVVHDDDDDDDDGGRYQMVDNNNNSSSSSSTFITSPLCFYADESTECDVVDDSTMCPARDGRRWTQRVLSFDEL